jgi:uncharacterized protein YcbX
MPASAIVVATLTTTPIKGLRVSTRQQVVLERAGLRGDRSFYLIDEHGRMVNGKHLAALNSVVADLDDDGRQLTLTFPGGEVISGAIERGPGVETRFFSQTRPALVLSGPFASALSQHAGQPLRLVAPADGFSAIDRGEDGAVSIISRASLLSLAHAAAVREIDGRRFRMSIEVTGAGPHEEDAWIGRELTLGAARVRLRGHVGRCIVTSRNPETGHLDLPTLDLLRVYREGAETTEPLAFGVYGTVLEEGLVRVGDAVELS